MSVKLYAVMSNSHRPFDKTILARVTPEVSDLGHDFWTDTKEERVWLMPRETAEEIVRNLHHNSPRIVGAEKAIDIIRKQHEQKLERRNAAAEPKMEGPDEDSSGLEF